MKLHLVFPVLALLLNLCCKEEEKVDQKPPNIVWIVSEDNSKHYLKLFDENGIETPNIEALAEHGIQFDRAFSNAPVCSVARSTIISGCYAPRIGAQFHRRSKLVPMPDSLRMFPAYLRDAGYYTANNSKEDYNLVKSDDAWDESSGKATWKKRKGNQPFFYVHNIGTTHESRIHFPESDMENVPTITQGEKYKVQPNHPDTELFHYTNARYRDKIKEMDGQLGEVVKALEADGLLENTFIFYYGDHGGVLPGSKGYLYETGLHVPMVVRIPENYKDWVDLKIGGKTDRFVSFIDLAPTVLNLAGVQIAEQIDGKPILGNGVDAKELDQENVTYGYADRFDEKYDMVRSVRKGKYKYIRNYQPFNFDGLMNEYRYKQAAYGEWEKMYEEGRLNEQQSAFFKSRAPEMLYDVESDPYETVNLAGDPKFEAKVQEMRGLLNDWVEGMPDLSFYPEFYLIENAFDAPVEFGRTHQKEIQDYIATANLMLEEAAAVQAQLKDLLQSSDPWQRYWALIVCSSFGDGVKALAPDIKEIAKNDGQAVNRVRAAEFLGITKTGDPVPIMLEALYSAQYETEALLILNSIVLLGSHDYGYNFPIDERKISPDFRKKKSEVVRRLEFLKTSKK
ncbi:sulfatase-like hydrolase/transferase [Zobellia galactanivorans]|uniref:sulfatase-like hydrolase/transferase n=1 Tax=Zobellia galactanivorans (strain DSM 12802 / CCUG 47099 / CIP 106680 / NCIMB 13871 / Dsij) TaxID=63186 RepID=UPI001C06B3BD|nr:sulfatase-like hydrolase/transferase [Zobellia galactanivorans]MBU3024231.1 sulfatase-like hydrolase/transferase [Zobellia galactanivorans]